MKYSRDVTNILRGPFILTHVTKIGSIKIGRDHNFYCLITILFNAEVLNTVLYFRKIICSCDEVIYRIHQKINQYIAFSSL